MSDAHWSQMMMPGERICQLENVNAELGIEVRTLRQKLEQAEARVAELEGRPIEVFEPLSDQECDQYARMPETFNDIIKKVYEDSYSRYCGKANQFFGRHYRDQFERCVLLNQAEAVEAAKKNYNSNSRLPDGTLSRDYAIGHADAEAAFQDSLEDYANRLRAKAEEQEKGV